MRTGIRAAWLVLHLLTGVALALSIRLTPRGRIAPEAVSRWWNGRLLKILHVRLSVRGQGLDGQRMVVSNHISWLDIPVIACGELTRFVAKAEVSGWPVAGFLATTVGTFYIRRGAGGTKQLIQSIARHLAGGGCATLFPEGTTSTGEDMLKFQPRLFGAAIDSGSPIQPVAVRYGRAANGENIAAFVGEQTLLDNLLRLLKEPELTVELSYCAPIYPAAGQDRASLAQAAQAAIRAVIAPDTGSRPAAADEGAERSWLAA